jgi:CcmD family protein
MMDDAGFIFLAYGVTFGGVLAYAWYVIRRGRKVAAQLPDDAKPWT